MYTHTHPFNGPFPGLPRRAGTRKVKSILILLNQETMSGGGISWAICKSAPRSRQITMPAPHHSVFLRAGCPSCHPTNSIKALKANNDVYTILLIWIRTIHGIFNCKKVLYKREYEGMNNTTMYLTNTITKDTIPIQKLTWLLVWTTV